MTAHWKPITYRWARRIAVALVGGTVLAIGVALIVLPGPAFVVIPIGLAILVLTIGFDQAGHIDFTFFPKLDSERVSAGITMPYGSAVEETRAVQGRVVEAAEKVLARHGGEEITRGILTHIGSAGEQRGGGGGSLPGGDGHLANVQVYLVPSDRRALTAAEFLAFECGMHVLVVMSDMTNYCESLREVSTIRGEIPSRKGYPGYLYSDLASLYERAGKIEGSPGSITQIPVLTMPSDDISHPVPDLTGYITEGQIVLERELAQKGIYPPVAGLPSLSRLMKDGIGPGMTRDDHKELASQLFAGYSRVKTIRSLAAVIGEEELSELDRQYLAFGERFEREFLAQGERDNRSIGQTLDLGWKVLGALPRSELYRVSAATLEAQYREAGDEPAARRTAGAKA